MSLEQKIRTTLKDAGTRIDTGEPVGLRPDAASSHRKGLTTRPVLAFVAAFVGVLLLGVVGLLVSGGPSSETEVRPLDSADLKTLDWATVDALPADYAVNAIAEGPNGWLALAGRFINSTGGDYLILRSEDGVDWTRIEASFPAAVHIDEIIGTDTGYVAYGLYAGEDYSVTTTDRPSNFPEPGVWTSNDGTGWQLTPLPLPAPDEAISEIVSYRAFNLVVDGSAAVVLGVEFDEDLPEVEGTVTVPTRSLMWVAEEAGQWRLIQTEQIEDLVDLTVGPAGVVASRATDTGISVGVLDQQGAWEQLSTLPGEGFQANVAGNEHGYLIQTSSGLHFSSDAVDWTPVQGPSVAAVIAAHSGGFTVVSRSGEAETVWWSPDGSTWTAVGTPEDLPVDLEFVSGAAATENSIAMYGQTQGGSLDIAGVEGFLIVGTSPR